MVRPLVRTVGNCWASRILSIHWQVPDRAGRTSHVAEVWHGLLGLQGTSPQVAVRPNHALQRTRRGVAVGNRRVPCAGSLSLGLGCLHYWQQETILKLRWSTDYENHCYRIHRHDWLTNSR